MTIFVENIQKNALLSVTVIKKCDLIEELRVSFRYVSSSLNTFDRLVVNKSVILIRIEILLNVGARRTDYVDVNREPMTTIFQKQHQATTALEMKWTARLSQQFQQRESSNDLLDYVLIVILKLLGLLLNPTCAKRFFTNHLA